MTNSDQQILDASVRLCKNDDDGRGVTVAEGFDVAELVSGLMAKAPTPGERRAIALLADAGMFDSRDFRRTCVRPRAEGVAWRRVREMWVVMSETDPRRGLLEDSTEMVALANSRPPESLEDLQIRIDVDGVDGITLAAWLDVYAADSRDPSPYLVHIDRCLARLVARFECTTCGRPAVALDDDDMPVCATCKKENN
ncbi:hypothetical protein [Nocardioides zhouii]|uniref:Uncharacterized protein n=1 Tax=Nocardioides zhouii TaxID=1168729 RepID=A0A4Q2T0Y0_9ACTN|nr:hypothetical protein [Nocardioides zhouii]RYC10550.1 hypothetical protein EUA94_12185 [Nocardioides zhouii]